MWGYTMLQPQGTIFSRIYIAPNCLNLAGNTLLKAGINNKALLMAVAYYD